MRTLVIYILIATKILTKRTGLPSICVDDVRVHSPPENAESPIRALGSGVLKKMNQGIYSEVPI